MKTLTEKDQGIILDLCDAGTDGSAGPKGALSAIRGIIQGPSEEEREKNRIAVAAAWLVTWLESEDLDFGAGEVQALRVLLGPYMGDPDGGP